MRTKSKTIVLAFSLLAVTLMVSSATAVPVTNYKTSTTGMEQKLLEYRDSLQRFINKPSFQRLQKLSLEYGTPVQKARAENLSYFFARALINATNGTLDWVNDLYNQLITMTVNIYMICCVAVSILVGPFIGLPVGLVLGLIISCIPLALGSILLGAGCATQLFQQNPGIFASFLLVCYATFGLVGLICGLILVVPVMLLLWLGIALAYSVGTFLVDEWLGMSYLFTHPYGHRLLCH